MFCIPMRLCPSSPLLLLPQGEKGSLGVLMAETGDGTQGCAKTSTPVRVRGQRSGVKLRTRNQEPGTRNQELRTKNQEPGTENQEPGTENQEPGTENQEPGTENREPGSTFKTQPSNVQPSTRNLQRSTTYTTNSPASIRVACRSRYARTSGEASASPRAGNTT